jgi:hypothetical protein
VAGSGTGDDDVAAEATGTTNKPMPAAAMAAALMMRLMRDLLLELNDRIGKTFESFSREGATASVPWFATRGRHCAAHRGTAGVRLR